ncbi:hypothetical protein, partial [Archangium sp.]|uniref:hypothetical protein n=1 Tax=Archangium sp. TaxID=1872627 RepID=UPI002D69650A
LGYQFALALTIACACLSGERRISRSLQQRGALRWRANSLKTLPQVGAEEDSAGLEAAARNG